MKTSKNFVLNTLSLCAFLMAPALSYADHLGARLFVNGKRSGIAEVGREDKIEITVHDKASGTQLREFTKFHEKYNHMLIVSEDLDTFAHVHPAPQSDGTFTLTVGKSSADYDPDNKDASRALKKGGKHYLFSEVQPEGVKEPHLLAIPMRVNGPSASKRLEKDATNSSGVYIKYFTPNSKRGIRGDEYRVALKVEPMSGMLHLTFRIEEKGDSGYQVVDDLENWLGMIGHGIMISEKGLTAGRKIFRHMHAGDHGGGHGGGHGGHHGFRNSGESIVFMLHGAEIPKEHGIYKVWGQFKHLGRVLTFPFVIEL
jgi:hypothetical protein